MFESPLRKLSEEEADKLNLRYYDNEVHRASFSLPRFIKQVSSVQLGDRGPIAIEVVFAAHRG